MAVTLASYGNNLIDPSGWTAGSGSIGLFSCNGDTGEQNRYIGTDPWGNSAMVWQTVPSGNGQADGGWNTTGVSIDNTKLYRFSVWVRRTSATSGGTFYFGLQSNNGNAVHLSNNYTEGNPYWDYRGTGALTQNTWYLFVGHCYPVAHNGTIIHEESGYYTVAGGTTKQGLNAGNVPNDVKWSSGTTTATHRTYHYYCGDSTTRLEFYMPRIDLVNGTQPSLRQLLTAGSNPQGLTFNDGTYQSSVQPDIGSLINVAQFKATGTWTKPTGCTKVIVKVLGGGGGAAGYCESGGAGGYSEALVDVTGVSTVEVTVGAGGAGVGYYAAATGGGTSSFGSYCSATGGGGANSYSSHSGGQGGSGSGGQVNLQGGGGMGHVNSVGHWGGRGGQGYFGGSGAMVRNHTNLGSGISNTVGHGSPGAGGPGQITNGGGYHNVGGQGERGLVLVYAYK
jgi:hypothetical protein